MAKRPIRSAAKPAARSTTRPAARSGAPVPQGGIRVRATKDGYYGDARRRAGDVFTLVPIEGTFHEKVLDAAGDPKRDAGGYVYTEVEKTLSAEDQFSSKWMEKVDGSTPEKTTTGKDKLRQQHDEEMKARRAPSGTGDADVL